MTDHKNIYMALAAAQSGIDGAKKGSKNPHFGSSYADLADVVAAVRPSLNENGICFHHFTEDTDLGQYMTTSLVHGASETSVQCRVPLIIGKKDMQGYKSATTYAKRIGLESVTGIAPEDDDGNAAASSPQTRMSWAETVIAEQCEDGASDEEKAEALTLALIAQFKRKKTENELSNEWDRRAKITSSFAERFPDKHSRIVDAYENRMLVITKQDVPSSHPAGEK